MTLGITIVVIASNHFYDLLRLVEPEETVPPHIAAG